jgi:hypothetical protein
MEPILTVGDTVQYLETISDKVVALDAKIMTVYPDSCLELRVMLPNGMFRNVCCSRGTAAGSWCLAEPKPVEPSEDE